MKKSYIQLAVAAVLLVGMVGALMLLNRPDVVPEPEADEEIYIVGSALGLPPKQIDVQNESGGYTLLNLNPGEDKAELTVKGLEKLSLDNYGLGGALASAQGMTAKELIAGDLQAEELAEFGLAKPRATVKISFAEDNSEATVLFGDDAPGGEGVYVKRADSSDVYLVMPSMADPFLKPELAYVNKAVTSTDPEGMGMDKVTLTGLAYPEPVVIEKSNDEHRITSPVKALLNAQNGLQPLMSVYGLIASDVVSVKDDAETLESFGLTEPYAAISVTGPKDKPEMSFTLRVSKPGDDGRVYAIRSGSAVIYELNTSSLPWLGLSTFDLMEKVIIMPYIDEVSAVTLSLPDKAYGFALTGELTELKVSLDGKDIDVSNFRHFYQTLILAKYDEPADQQPEENAAALVKIKYSYEDGRADDVVSFYPGPTRRAYVALNDGSAYLCQSAYVDKLVGDVGKIASGEAIRAY